MSSIWVRTKSYLWGNNGEQLEVTWPEVTLPEVTWPEDTLPEPEVCYAHAQLEVSQYPYWSLFTGSDVSDRKRPLPEVIVCACATGTLCITTRVVVQVPWLPVNEGHPKGWKDVRMPSEAFSPEVGYRKWRHFKGQMNEICDIFIMCFVLFLFVTCFGWNFNAIVVVVVMVVVVVEEEEEEEEEALWV